MSSETAALTVENAKRELGHVSWSMLLSALGIDCTIETRISEECHGDENAAIGQTLRHWFDNYESSWEALAKALMSLPLFKRVGAYIHNKYVNPECFTAEKISEELSFIEDWFQAAYPYIDDSEKIRSAVKNVPVEARRVKVFELWLRYYDKPSWEEVARGVEDCFPEWEDKAESLRKKYLPDVKFRRLAVQEMSPLEELSSKTAFIETSDVKDWYALGWFLGISEDKLEAIEEDHSRTDNRRQAVLDLWLKENEANANWPMLGKAISSMRQHHGLSRRIIERSQKMKDSGTGILQRQGEVERMDEDTGDTEVEVARQLAEKAKELSERVDDIKQHVGGIQVIVRTLDATEADVEKIQKRVQSALEEVKSDLDGLNSVFHLDEEVPETEGNVSAETRQKSTVIPTSILKEMEIIAEQTAHFNSDEEFSLNWENYGCKLHIQKGSIKEGESGSLHIYAIYSGPFQLPKGMELASAIYYISLSHELLKPATLEIEHCSNTENGKPKLSFITIPDTASGPPYSFEAIEGGDFSGGNCCTIQRSQFSGYGVAFVNWIKSFFGYTAVGILHFLIASRNPNISSVKLFLIKYLEAHKEHFKKQVKSSKKRIVSENFKKVTLTDKAAQVAVSRKEETSPIIEWNGFPLRIASEWEITSESTGDFLELCPDEIEEGLAPSLDINIEWKGVVRPAADRDQFRIHILRIEGVYNFPVSIPPQIALVSLTSSTYSESVGASSFEEEEEILEDPPQLPVFLNRVTAKLSCSSDKIAVHLLNPDSFNKFKRMMASQRREGDNDYRVLYEEWKNEGSDFTWAKIIEVLECPSIQEHTLANSLRASYSDVFP